MPNYRENANHAWTEDSVRLILTPSPFSRESLYHAQEIGRFVAFPGYFTERERLSSYLIVYTIAGGGKLVYGGETHSLRPGQIFMIDCMEYQYYAAEDEGWEMAWAHVSGPALGGQYGFYSTRGGPVRTLTAGSRIPALLEELLAHNETRSLRNELLASATISILLTELMLLNAEADRAETVLPGFVADAMRYIERHAGERLTLDRLAGEFAMSKYPFAKAFKRYSGFSPGEYIINTRISRAKELLKYSEHTVVEISGIVGIDNVSHFINLFRAREKQTPLAYRKTWKSPRA
ncbi:AraC family transcriptional regulator [Cohnella sp. AR92]|uniref:helix-turn-helix domain-containing protein n=1 Tax=Cohnella sp. AR92 TaxID=648716 RepID=UPI000F8E84E9|nr:AraC family transcriptional regulator [Cohnella sp. AR92]RUS41846.1 AraC family transcriptional regulator [Cohnella sp. AR92]